MAQKKVLIVEDMPMYHHQWYIEISDCEREIEMVSATTLEEARTKFAANPDIDIIVMDACVPGDRPNTYSLTQEMRKTFKGPMIACSTIPEYREILMQAGCDYASSKTGLVQLLIEIIDSM